MRTSLTISAFVHVAVLLLCLVALTAQPLEAPATPALSVSTISVKDFSEMTQGVKNAPKLKVDDIKPLADTVDTPKPVKELAPKVSAKPDISTESKPKPAKPDPKPTPKPDKAKAAQPKVDQIAQELKKEEVKQPPKPQDKPAQEKPAAHDAPKFDPSQVAALLDKRDPQRQVASAETLNATSNLGAANGQAAQLSQTEIDALRARISQCWNPPAGVDINSKLYVVLRVLFKQDGSIASDPVVVEGSASALGPALAESGKRALLRCQPFTMLKPEHYEQWKDIEVKFDPHEMLGG
jgi:colicin import membrane protein